jgi:hypothetical protein
MKGAQARNGEDLDPHPIVAPLAWASCFAFGAAVWVFLLWRIL